MKNDGLITKTLSLLLLTATGPVLHAQTADVTARVAQLVQETKPNFYINEVVLSVPGQAGVCEVASKSCKSKPMPVTLVSFEGVRLDGQSALLSWETADETNNDYFVVERTLNPRLGFEQVGTVQGAGTTKSSKKYQLQDHNSFETYTYYRLKQVDFDGTFEYSQIIAIKGTASELSIAAFPNPGPAKNIRFLVSGLQSAITAEILVYDSNGRLVHTKQNKTIQSEEPLKPDLPNLPVGKYTLKLTTGQREVSSSFVVTP